MNKIKKLKAGYSRFKAKNKFLKEQNKKTKKGYNNIKTTNS